MARWRLVEPHYLNTKTSTWEYSEVNRTTGRPTRVSFDVPTHLNPNDPGDWTHRWGNRDNEDGYIIVKQGEGEAHDIAFIGDPTPGMVPLDDEAKAISAKFENLWRYKPEGEGMSYSQSLVDQIEHKMADVQSKPAQVEGMSDLIAAIAAQTASNAKLMETLSTRRL